MNEFIDSNQPKLKNFISEIINFGSGKQSFSAAFPIYLSSSYLSPSLPPSLPLSLVPDPTFHRAREEEQVFSRTACSLLRSTLNFFA